MSVPRCLALVFVLFAACDPALGAQADPGPKPAEARVEVDEELALVKKHLFNDEDLASSASWAGVLLYRDDAAARALVIEALRHAGNPTTREAVCKALDRSRTDPRPLKGKEDFLEPLLGLLGTEEETRIARLAAEATLMFSYDQVQSGLEAIAADAQRSSKVRSNAVYVLQLHPDKRAAVKLMGLLDSADGDVAQAAKKALMSLGIAVGEDAEGRRQVIDELQQQGAEAYLRKRLVRSEADIRELEADIQGLRAESASWQQHYFSALGEWYDSIGDEAARSAFLAKRLESPENATILWVLTKLEELKQGTSKPKLSEGAEKTLMTLVSHDDRQVRLRTAQLLALMWELNSAEPLLEQLKEEQDPQVSRELFVALGRNCYYASLPTSKLKIADGTRKTTLQWAVRFLDGNDVETVRSGADVIGKLLTQDGLEPNDVNGYLASLADRYRRVDGQDGSVLRSELLNAMAGLCDQRSQCKSPARALYGRLFNEALSDRADAVRRAAVDGLANTMDKAVALRQLVDGNFHNDTSAAIRAKLIDLAGEVGVGEDLLWLQGLVGSNGAEPAWQAMLKIFGRLTAESMGQWIARFETPEMQKKLTLEQQTSFLTLVEQKAQAENNAALLGQVRQRLAVGYAGANNAQQAMRYLQLVRESGADGPNKDGLWSDLLRTCLTRSHFDLAGEIIKKYLEEKDLSRESPVVQSIEGYLNDPPQGADPNSLRKTLGRIEVPDTASRPQWGELRQHWTVPLAKAKEGQDVQKANN